MPHARGNASAQSCATRLVQGGVDLYKVPRLLEQTSPIMTQRYRESGQLCTQANHRPHKHGFQTKSLVCRPPPTEPQGLHLLHSQLPSRLAISQHAGAVLSDPPGRDGWIAGAQAHKHAGLLVAGDEPQYAPGAVEHRNG